MFASTVNFRTRAATRAANTIDLLIELATLGEYGLEYPDTPAGDAARQDAKRQLERHRAIMAGNDPDPLAPDAVDASDVAACPGSGRNHRNAPSLPAASPRRNPAKASDRPCGSPDHRRPTSQLPAALHPPRIRFSDNH